MSTETITESGHDETVPRYRPQFLYDPQRGLYVPTEAYAPTDADQRAGSLIRAAAAAERLLGLDLDLRRGQR